MVCTDERFADLTEEVAVVSSTSSEAWNASTCLKLHRADWVIDKPLHQRLDVSFDEDRCRVQSCSGLWVLSVFRRLANSPYA